MTDQTLYSIWDVFDAALPAQVLCIPSGETVFSKAVTAKSSSTFRDYVIIQYDGAQASHPMKTE